MYIKQEQSRWLVERVMCTNPSAEAYRQKLPPDLTQSRAPQKSRTIVWVVETWHGSCDPECFYLLFLCGGGGGGCKIN